MTIDAKYDNKIHANLCAAIKSLSPENKFAFAPFLSAEEHNLMREATIHKDIIKKFNSKFTNYLNDRDNGRIEKDASFDPEKQGVCGYKSGSACDDAIKTINLMISIVKRLEDQLSECGSFTNIFPSPKFQNNYGSDYHSSYHFHRDTSPDSHIRLSLALKGKGTVFTNDQPHYNHNYSSDENKKILGETPPISSGVVSTPELHIAAFTIGGMPSDFAIKTETNGGAIHSVPIYDQSEVDCSRIVLLPGFSPIDATTQE